MASGFQRQSDPGGDPLLAELLEACLNAEEVLPGSSAEAIQAAPAHLQLDLQRLIEEGRALRAAAHAPAPAPEFRDAARARLIATMAADIEHAASPYLAPGGRRWLSWLGRPRGRWTRLNVAACLMAIAVTSYTAISASAGALPGDTLYGLKLTREYGAVRLEPSAVARASTLLDQADVRLDEVDRLLQKQQLAEVASTTGRYATAIAEATDQLAAAPAPDRSAALRQSRMRLDGQLTRLETLVLSAPAAAAPALRNAVAANLELGQVADADAPATPTVSPGAQSSPAATTVQPSRAPAASPMASLSPTANAALHSTTTPPSRPGLSQRLTPEPVAGTPQPEPTKRLAQP